VITVGLTGNVASGKSTVARIWGEAGVPVVSADDLARRAVLPGSAGLERVVDVFGKEVLSADGSMDRSRLREIVFDDSDARARLESILHPIIWGFRDEWLQARRAEGAPLVVAEIPLLFETGREGEFDVVVFVDASVEVRLRRMLSDRGLSEEAARAIIDAQMDPSLKREGSDYVLTNDGSLEDLRSAAEGVLEELRAELPAEGMRIDMHLHTAGSWDCLSDPERVLSTALALGYDRIAITDHNRLDVALRMAEVYPDRIIPGEEVKTAEGIDVIGLYLEQEIPKGTPAEETIQRIRSQGGIPYLPHPYAAGKGGGGKYAESLAPLCDVIEVFNARLHAAEMNERALELARRHEKLVGAGSDAHTLGELGHAFVDLPAHENRPGELLGALRAATTGGHESSRLVHLASTWAKVRKKLPAPPRA
jgi:dephospho-CoA kinase